MELSLWAISRLLASFINMPFSAPLPVPTIIAVGVASNEAERQGINEAKRQQLIQVGADIIIPDFRESEALLQYWGM